MVATGQFIMQDDLWWKYPIQNIGMWILEPELFYSNRGSGYENKLVGPNCCAQCLFSGSKYFFPVSVNLNVNKPTDAQVNRI